MEDKYDISRKPSKNERIFGIVASFFLVLFFGTTTVLFRDLLSAFGWRSLVPIVFGLATFLAAIGVYRIAFGKAETLSRKSARIISYLFIASGIFLIGISVLSGDTSKIFYGIGIGIIGVSTGLQNLLSR